MSGPTLAELRRAMNDAPGELARAGLLGWAIDLVADRAGKCGIMTPAGSRYMERWRVLTDYEGRQGDAV